MSTYDAPSTRANNLQNSCLSIAETQSKLYYPHFIYKVTEHQGGKSLVQGHKSIVWQSQNEPQQFVIIQPRPSLSGAQMFLENRRNVVKTLKEKHVH